MHDFKEIAESYWDYGFEVIPVKNKLPFTTKWQQKKLEEFTDSEWKKANGIGLRCGSHSGVVAFDIDILDAHTHLQDFKKELLERLPPPLILRQGNPDKEPTRFFKYSGVEFAKHKFNSIHVELLSSSNQCVLPPSKHPNGGEFKWVGRGQGLLDVDIDMLPTVSDELFKWLDEQNKRFHKLERGDKSKGVSAASGRCAHGSNNAISAYAYALLCEGYDANTVKQLSIKYDKKINAKSEYVYFNCPSRKDFKGMDIDAAADKFVSALFASNSESIGVNKWESENDGHGADASENDLGFLEKVKGSGFYFMEGEKELPSYRPMGVYLSKVMKFRCDDSYKAFYDNDYYSFVSKNRLQNEIVKLTHARVSPSHIDNFVKIIMSHCYFEKDKFNSPVGLINMQNGVLDIKAGKLLDFSHKYNFTYKLKHEFDPSAKCLEFMKFLDFVFYGDEELINLIGEIIGYTLLGGDPFAHKAFMFYGSGRNGKSTLLDVIIELLGADNISSISMALIDKPFSTVRLDGKLANIVEESPSNINPEAFKNITAGGRVTAARKGMDEFDLKVNARLFFACNEFPHFKDNTKGNRDRLIIVPFDRYIPEADRDVTIKSRLAGEMSGVLNFALDGLQRFVANGNKFTKSVKVEEKLQEYILENDSVYQFLDEYLEFINSDGAYVTSSYIYDKYKDFCIDRNHKCCSFTHFCRRATSFYSDIYNKNGFQLEQSDRFFRADGKTIRGIKRFSMKSATLF